VPATKSRWVWRAAGRRKYHKGKPQCGADCHQEELLTHRLNMVSVCW
jgi:hypothetical protein